MLQTKLYIPPLRPNIVPRSQLIARLNRSFQPGQKMTLLSAPAGFGKSTLLSEWVAVSKRPAAWLSLDESDNDLPRFLSYFVAALQTIESGIGQGLLPALQSPGPLNVDLVLTTLLNEIAQFPQPVAFILDDYHLIESPSVDQTLTFLVEHLPPQLHLIIATRVDPSLPLSRLRARGQMIEIRVDDLRFSFDEVTSFLHQVKGLELSARDVATLESRTEGWIAGLQLAALSLKGIKHSGDTLDFINNFAGSNRYIQDYLTDEVLQQQTRIMKDFLLQTSILDRLSGPLCDAVRFATEETSGGLEDIAVNEVNDSQSILESLEAANLFLVPLDHDRNWYRYHSLFSDLLRQRLQLTYPERIEQLRARASQWLDEHGYTQQAITQALAMDDKNLAADLIERHAKKLLYQDRIRSMLDWYELLPEKMLRERPLLIIYHTWTLVFDDPFERFKEIEQKLAQAQQALEAVASDVAVEKLVAGHIASIRALLSQPPIQVDYDPITVLGLLHDAQDLLPLSETFIRSDNYINIGYEYMSLCDTEAALGANESAFVEARASGNHLVAIVSIRNQALIAYHLGELTRAIDICQEGIALFNQLQAEEGQPQPGLCILYIALGFMFLERGELQQANLELSLGIELPHCFTEYEAISLSLIGLTRLLLITGDDDKTLQSVKRFSQHLLTIRPLSETLRILVACSRFDGELGTREYLLDWMEGNQPDLQADSFCTGITPWNETRHLAHLTWIQSQIALTGQEPDLSQITALKVSLDYLDRRLQDAQHKGLLFRVIECLVLKSLVLNALGDDEKAVIILSQAISLAELEGYRRVFLDKGQQMGRLLRKVSEKNPAAEFTRQLVNAVEQPLGLSTEPVQQDLIEPLSKRELEVLQLVADGLTNREIGERLFLALDTVKGHNHRIFGKLGVKSRTQAVNKAISLKIISPR